MKSILIDILKCLLRIVVGFGLFVLLFGLLLSLKINGRAIVDYLTPY